MSDIVDSGNITRSYLETLLHADTERCMNKLDVTIIT
jgi:hypothetical protein